MDKKQRRNFRRQAKHKKEKSKMAVIRYVILWAIVMILVYMGYGIYQEGKVKNKSSKQEHTDMILLENENAIKEETKVIKPTEAVVERYSGYKVDSRLEVPKIKLKTNVLTEYSTEGLEKCASKYYGPEANGIGNYCIAGHNYNQKNMFNHLIDLKIGDSLFLTNNKSGIVEYEIYDIYKVKPQNVEPLSQKTNGKREVTLITCVNYSKNRLVVKAAERKE